uniref:Unannotated protein n=1 Tax=freshwater metagenome TaxID=449393 RepID=A0A6J7Q5X8_9ZZZZ
MLWSFGEVTFTMRLSCTCSVRLHPTPQYGHTVVVSLWRDTSHVPSARMSNSVDGIKAPVGHTAMQFPQYTQAESGRAASNSTAMRASNPRPATEMAKVFWNCSPQASTHW